MDEERIANIPNLLEKYEVDAWLVRLHFFSSSHSPHTFPYSLILCQMASLNPSFSFSTLLAPYENLDIV